MIFKRFFLLTIYTVFLISCTDEEEALLNNLPLGAYDNGVFILNQGNFGQDNSSISYLSDDLALFQSNSFLAVNPTKILGNTAQDIGFYNDLAFVVVNVSNKIEVLNRYTLQHIATINSGLNNPRYIIFSEGKGFVTNWGDGSNTTDDYVAVLNLSNYTVSNTISVVEGPERIVENNGKLYVAHQGGFGFGNSVSVINASTNSVVTSINVGDVPNSLQIVDGSLVVLCGGKPAWTMNETNGKLVSINLSNETISSALDFNLGIHPSNLAIEGNEVFYCVNSSIFKMNLSNTSLPIMALFTSNAQNIYSFAVKNNKIWIGDAKDFNSSGSVFIYEKTGLLTNQFTVGVIPVGFYFN